MRRLLLTSIVMTLLLGLCTLGDFLSLHDIRADYVSNSVFGQLGMPVPEGLPSWTDTRLEWASLQISFVVRSLLVAGNLVVLGLLVRGIRGGRGLEALEKEVRQ